jgi:hypothetical protein
MKREVESLNVAITASLIALCIWILINIKTKVYNSLQNFTK